MAGVLESYILFACGFPSRGVEGAEWWWAIPAMGKGEVIRQFIAGPAQRTEPETAQPSTPTFKTTTNLESQINGEKTHKRTETTCKLHTKRLWIKTIMGI